MNNCIRLVEVNALQFFLSPTNLSRLRSLTDSLNEVIFDQVLAAGSQFHYVDQTIVFSGDDSASQRVAKLEKIRMGEYDVLLATGQLFGEGMHVATIETQILAFPFAFEGKLAQYAGRLLHSDQPRQLIDYRDAQVAGLEKQHKQRRRYYNSIFDIL